MASINASVGSQAANQLNDVRIVQGLLNQYASRLGAAPLTVDGHADARTVAAIKLFQLKIAGMMHADGRVDPGGRTWNTLAKGIAKPAAQQLSGAAWWHANQARFPNSADLSALDAGFRLKVDKFLAAMRAAGLKVQVRSTRRNKVRAYLMHYSWKVAKGLLAAGQVPAETGCDIVWDHGNAQASKLGAQQMVDLFNVVYQPALNSRHISGLAIDMDIAWNGQPKIRDGAGKDVTLGVPADGTNTVLHQVGRSYGVVKNVADRPHWSDNGH